MMCTVAIQRLRVHCGGAFRDIHRDTLSSRIISVADVSISFDFLKVKYNPWRINRDERLHEPAWVAELDS